MKKENIRTQVRVPKEIYEEAKKLCDSEGVSFNRLVVVALTNLTQKGKASSTAEVKEALDLISHTLGYTKL